MSTWYSLIVFILGLIGFLIAEMIINKKKKNETLTCPVGFDCNDVVYSKYARFLGISVVHLGRYYYLAIAAFYLLSIFVTLPQQVTFIAIIISGLGLLFSFYLTVIQLFVLKKWCSWCLFAALVNVGIVTISFTGFSTMFIEFLYDFRDLLRWVFALATIIGTVVTTLHAFTFVKFLKDFTISPKEYRRLGMFSHTAWIALAFVFLTGLGLVLTDTYREITGNSEFLVMGIIIGMLAVYEFIQNAIVAPRLIDIHFGDAPLLDDHEHNYQRKVAFSFASIGIASWYLLMLFSNLSWHEYTPLYLVGLYVVILIVGVIISLLAERIVYQKSLKNNN